MNRGELAISSFNRENCKTGIVHLGVGNFHRAHQANYIDEYLNTFNNMNWGISVSYTHLTLPTKA